MIIVLLLKMMEEWEGWGAVVYLCCSLGWGQVVGDKGWVSYFSYFLLCFCAVVNCSVMVGT